jgi:predicted RNase H-like nuclease (RuvC/YqgF family)
MGTKFQEVHKKWSGGSLGSPALDQDIETLYKTSIQSGSSSVRSLSSRFDYKDNREVEDTADSLKRTVNDQAKQISNLRAQVESKDKKIQELEEKVLSLTRNNTPLTSPMAFSQQHQSFA